MLNINEGSYSMEEVQDFCVPQGKHLSKVHAAGIERDDITLPMYDHWEPIKHPETNEQLTATCGYIDDSGRCYYAEYRTSDNKYYNYVGSNISHQQNQDKLTASRESFSQMMNGQKCADNANNQVAYDNPVKNDIKR